MSFETHALAEKFFSGMSLEELRCCQEAIENLRTAHTNKMG